VWLITLVVGSFGNSVSLVSIFIGDVYVLSKTHFTTAAADAICNFV
jgi:hypothetical protein